MDYSYLWVSLVIAMAGALGAVAVPRHRRFVIISGILAAPAGLADWLFVPEYWYPKHLIGSWLSLEGLLFSFGNGCLVGALVVLRWPHLNWHFPRNMIDPLWRIATITMLGLCAFLLVWQGGFGKWMIMHATFFGFAAILLFFQFRGRFSIEIALTAGLGFTLLYGIETLAWRLVDPAMARFWASNDIYWFLLPFPPELPIEEYLWAFGYGGIWAHFLLCGVNEHFYQTSRL